MSKKLRFNDVLKKVLLSLLAGILLSWAVSEIAYFILKTGETRPPKKVELTIPRGTAELVAQGRAALPIPSRMFFVVGDTLQVNNQDIVPHQFGALYIAAGSSASMLLDTAQNYTYSCSFCPGQYIGVAVNAPLDISTRLIGILQAGVPMGFLIALYTIFAVPSRKKLSV